ncbi:transposase [Streptomyces kunmingensis]|uniref:Transposase n=1 Tax=Streptomyces kunmingensis TaxID=68225 RepID=A0ABU6CMI2_9ACTN|nr:transposase [Streptomyces kunmingensis]MEB3965105.1 transposase [Streptomyces kunmingensis]
MIPRTFPSAPAWSADGHRIKSELDYTRGPEKTWIFGGLRIRDGHGGHHDRSLPQQHLLPAVPGARRKANPAGAIWIVTDNLSAHRSVSTREWLEGHPRIRHAFIPVGACWLNLQEGWWRLFRKTALAGRSFCNPHDIAYATKLATAQLNTHAQPWVWGRPAPPTRTRRRRYVYVL